MAGPNFLAGAGSSVPLVGGGVPVGSSSLFDLPLLTTSPDHWDYLGYFTFPGGNMSSNSGGTLCLGPTPGTIYAANNQVNSQGYGGGIGLFNIPPDANLNGAATTVNIAVNTNLQTYVTNATNSNGNSGLIFSCALVNGSNLCVGYYLYYPAHRPPLVPNYFIEDTGLASNTPAVNLVLGTYRASACYSGAIVGVPPEWQNVVGGDAMCCMGNTPIDGSMSFGPSIYFFYANTLGGGPIAAREGMFYPHGTPVSGFANSTWNTFGQSPIPYPSDAWSYNDTINTVFIAPGTRSLVYVGIHGAGIPMYGVATSTYSLNGTQVPASSDIYCYNPPGGGVKGQNNYPQHFYVRHYDMIDVVNALQGNIPTSSLVPVDTWMLNVPTSLVSIGETTAPAAAGNGAACFDPTTNRLYLGLGRGRVAVYQCNFSPGTNLTCSNPITLPTGTVGVPYSYQLDVSGGTPPYTYTINSYYNGTGSVTNNVVAISATGLLTNTAGYAEWDFITVIISDSVGNTFWRLFKVQVA